MRFDVLTLFPELLRPALAVSIPGRAIQGGQLVVGLHDIRRFAENKHNNVDDMPYGGGAGMVMQAGPIVRALEWLAGETPIEQTILMSPSGARFDQTCAERMARGPAELEGAAATGRGSTVLICGRYEGVDQRVVDGWCDAELSIGDYVLSGGEPAALVIIDTVARLLPGVLGNERSTDEESLVDGLLEYPHYTRPREFRGRPVPDVLLSGNHGAIARWRRAESLRRTRHRRPDLWAELSLSANDKKLLES